MPNPTDTPDLAAETAGLRRLLERGDSPPAESNAACVTSPRPPRPQKPSPAAPKPPHNDHHKTATSSWPKPSTTAAPPQSPALAVRVNSEISYRSISTSPGAEPRRPHR